MSHGAERVWREERRNPCHHLGLTEDWAFQLGSLPLLHSWKKATLPIMVRRSIQANRENLLRAIALKEQMPELIVVPTRERVLPVPPTREGWRTIEEQL